MMFQLPRFYFSATNVSSINESLRIDRVDLGNGNNITVYVSFKVSLTLFYVGMNHFVGSCNFCGCGKYLEA